MFLVDMLKFFAKSVSSACWLFVFDEPQADKDLL